MQVGSNESTALLGDGTVRVYLVVDGIQHLATLHDVICAPESMYNLISIFRVRMRTFIIIIDEEKCC